jgi:hypothetical protein
LAWRTVLLPAALLLLLVVAAAGIFTLVQPRPAPDPSPRGEGEVFSATLRTRTAATSIEYLIPAGLDLAVNQPWPYQVRLAPVDSADRGVDVADVTFFSLHDRGRTTTSSATEFLEIVDRSDHFSVSDRGSISIGSQTARQAVIDAEPGAASHIDLVGTGTVEFGRPNVTFVVEVGERLVVVQIWANSDAGLTAWMPDAMSLVESMELSPTAPVEEPRR